MRFERRVPAEPVAVATVRHELTEWTVGLGLDEDQRHAVRLAVTEAMTNAVVHAFVGREPGTVHVVGEPHSGALEVRVADDGRGMGPRADSPGLGMGVPLMGKLATTVDLGPGPRGTGTEVRLLFAVPGLRPPDVDDPVLLDEILDALDASTDVGAFETGGIIALADLLVPRLCDLCSIALVDEDGRARRVGARVVGVDGTPDAQAAEWVMAFPLTAPTSPSALTAATGRTNVVDVDRAWCEAVSPDLQRADELEALGLTWWAAVPLRSAGRPVGSISVAGRAGDAHATVAVVERVAELAGALVATARLVDDLRRGRDRLQRILGALSEAVTVRDDDGRIVYANEAATRLHRPLGVVPLPDGLTEVVDPVTDVARWLRATSSTLPEGLIVTVTQDVTAAQEADALRGQLEASLSRLQLLIDAGFGGLIQGRESRIEDANRTFLEMVGYASVADLPPWPEMTPPEWASVDAEALRQLRERGKSDLFRKEYVRADGTRVPVLIAVAVTDPETFEWIGVIVDLSESHEEDVGERTGLASVSAGAPPVERRRGTADVLNGLAVSITILRPGEGIVYANPAAVEALAMESAADLLSRPAAEVYADWVAFDEDGAPVTPADLPSSRVLAGERTVDPLVVRAVHVPTGRAFWRILRARGIFDEAGALQLVVALVEDITEERRAVLTQRLLADAGRVLGGVADPGRALRELVALPVPALADRCLARMPDDHGRLRSVASAPAATSECDADDAAAAEVLRTGRAVLLDDPGPDARSVAHVPIVAATGAPIGVLTFVTAPGGQELAEADVALAEELGRRAGTAIQHARLHAERAEIAATLQRSLLPGRLPLIPGHELDYVYEPAGEENWVGGDFLDAFVVDDGWMLIMGDVAGHGAQAAALTARARHTLRAIGELTGDPVAAVAHLNRLLLADPEPQYVTVCVVAVADGDAASTTARVVSAGHPLPYRRRGGVVEAVGRPGLLLGAWDTTFEAVDVELRSGDALCLYTDGVTECRQGTERFGDARLEAVLADGTGAADTVARVRQALAAFRTGEQGDDTALLVVQRT